MKISKKIGQRRRLGLRGGRFAVPPTVALIAVLSGPVTASRAATLVVDSGSGNSPYSVTANHAYTLIEDGTTGTGVINQTGYTITDSGNLEIGYDPSSTGGTYNLSGTGTLSVAGILQVSDDANTSLFSQTGGTVTAGSVSLTGFSTSSVGTYTLSGGTLTTSTITEGDNGVVGTSTFNFNGGTLQASGASTTFMTGLTHAYVQGGGAIINTGAYAITIGQNLLTGAASDGGLTVQGTTNGLMTLSGANTFNGPTTVSSGATLGLASVGALGSTSSITLNGTGVGYYSIVGLSGNVVNPAATLTLNGTSAFQAEGDPLTVASLTGVAGTKLYIGDYVISPTTYAGPFTVGNGSSTTFAGVIVGTAASGTLFTKVGAGTLMLSGANTYTGPTAINGGVLQAASAQTGTTSGPLGASGTISFGGGTLQYSTANQFDYSSRFSTAASQAYSIDTNSQNVTFATALTSSGGSLTKLGAGTLMLSGANTYTGPTAINGGVLQAASAQTGTTSGPLGASGTISFGGGTLQYSASNTYDYSSRFSTAAGQTFNVDTNGQNVTFATAVGGTTSDSFTKLGAGTLTLTAANTYTGGTTITAGVLSLGNSAALNSTNGTILFSGGTLQYGSGITTDYSGRISGTAGQAFKIDTNGNNVVFASALGPSANSSLTKLGTGTLILSSTGNTFTSGTTITGGTLLLNGSSSVTGSGGISIGTAGTLASAAGAKGFVTGLVTTAGTTSVIAPGATATSNTGTVGALTLTGGLNLTAGATIPFDLGTSSDRINVTGGTLMGASSAGSITFNFNDLGTTPGTTYDLINYTGATASNLAVNEFTATGVMGNFALNGTELDFVTVPEPATHLGGLLLVGAAGWHQRRRIRGWFAGRRSKAMA